MKTILCYGDSNTWGCVPVTDAREPPRRLPEHERWPGVLRRALGSGYRVVEDGLNGRTTAWDDALEPDRNGKEALGPALLTQQPLDLVIVMLGLNDLKRRFGLSPCDVAAGVGLLLDLIAASRCGPADGAPEALLVCPPPLGRLELFAADFEGATEKSRALAPLYALEAERRGAAFVDAGEHIAASEVDGLHLDRTAHARFGTVLADSVRRLLEA